MNEDEAPTHTTSPSKAMRRHRLTIVGSPAGGSQEEPSKPQAADGAGDGEAAITKYKMPKRHSHEPSSSEPVVRSLAPAPGQEGMYFESCVLPGYYPQGGLSECQDTSVLEQALSGRAKTALAAVYDGHGGNGRLVAEWLAGHMPSLIKQTVSWGEGPKGYSRRLKEVFQEADSRLYKSNIDCHTSGSTATVALLDGTDLVLASCGDSRAVLARATEGGGGLQAVELSVDHKPTSFWEKVRIYANGAYLRRLRDGAGVKYGPKRVWLRGEQYPGLAMSRSIGDHCLRGAVVPKPDVTVTSLGPQDRFVLLASDGLWDVFSTKEAVEFAADLLARGGEVPPTEALAREAQERSLVQFPGTKVDDTTVVLIRLN